MKPSTPSSTVTKTQAEPQPHRIDTDHHVRKPSPDQHFAKHHGDKQIVDGIGDTGDEETERHSSHGEKNEQSRSKE